MEPINGRTLTYNDFVSKYDKAVESGLLTSEQAELGKAKAYQLIQQRDANEATIKAFDESDDVSKETKLYNRASGDLKSYKLSDELLSVTNFGKYIDTLYKSDEERTNGHIFEIGNTGFYKDTFNNGILTMLHRQGYDTDEAINKIGIKRVENGWKVDNNFKALSVFSKAYSDAWNDASWWQKRFTDSADSFVGKMKQKWANASFLPSDQSTFKPNELKLYSDHSILMAMQEESNKVNDMANKRLTNEGLTVVQDNNLVGLYQTNLGSLQIQLNRANGQYKNDTEYKTDLDITEDNFWAFFTNASEANYKMYGYGGDNMVDYVRELNPNNKEVLLDNLSEIKLNQDKKQINDIIKEELNQVDREKNISRLHISFGMSGGQWGHIINVDAAPKSEKYKGHQGFKIFVPYDIAGNSPENNIVTKFINRPENMAIQNIADLTSKNNSKIRKAVTFGTNKSLAGTYRYLGKNNEGVQIYEFNSSESINPTIVTRDELTSYLSKCYLYDQSVNAYAYASRINNGILPNGKTAYEAYLDNLNSTDEFGYTFADYVTAFTGQNINKVKQSFEEDFKLR